MHSTEALPFVSPHSSLRELILKGLEGIMCDRTERYMRAKTKLKRVHDGRFTPLLLPHSGTTSATYADGSPGIFDRFWKVREIDPETTPLLTRVRLAMAVATVAESITLANAIMQWPLPNQLKVLMANALLVSYTRRATVVGGPGTETIRF